MYQNTYGTIPLSQGGRRDITYSLTDIIGNTTLDTFFIYRLPDIRNKTLTQTGGKMYYSFTSDIESPIELIYPQ
jgi:hypothetical protein